MCLVFVYSFAFMFVKIYAEKSILSDEEPSDAMLMETYVEETGSAEPAVTVASEPEAEPTVSQSERQPVEYIVNKMAAAQYPMLMNAATAVTDTIEINTVAEAEATTAPESSEPKTTTAETTEKKAKTTTEPSKTKETEQPAPEVEEDDVEELDDLEEDIDDEEDEEPQEEMILDEELESDILREPEDGFDFKELTDDELAELLKTLGVSSLDELLKSDSSALSNSSDRLYSQNSYKNQTLTIYDTNQKRMRTENAFDLVCEITNREVGGSMDPEAIKAQAVAVYTYCKYYEQKGEYAELGTKSDVPDIVRECVEAVDGLAMYYDGKYIMSAFSASTGGFTASSKNVWGGDLPYLRSVANDFDYLDTKYYGKTETYTVEEVRSKIESKTNIKLSNNYSEWIRVLKHNDNIYAGQLSIDGHTSAVINGKERDITGHIFRTYILGIRSTAFTVTYADGVFTFTTYGYGHGVGMSQIGADLYAKYGGYTFDQILHHYYTGVTIE